MRSNLISQIERKRHIGNDIVNVVFMDGGVRDLARFHPACIKSNFTHVYAVVARIKDREDEDAAYVRSVFSEQ